MGVGTEKKATIADAAQKSGVSKTTVSRYKRHDRPCGRRRQLCRRPHLRAEYLR
ncbi:MAG: hypothetical protein DBX49_05450 [Clostridia bacterium]|nr:MAG: hypothetical protein DBX49_05450 [Clostridia bacterium]